VPGLVSEYNETGFFSLFNPTAQKFTPAIMKQPHLPGSITLVALGRPLAPIWIVDRDPVHPPKFVTGRAWPLKL